MENNNQTTEGTTYNDPILERIRKQKEEKETKTNGNQPIKIDYKKVLWSLNSQLGKQTIRILPPKAGEDVFQEVYFHDIQVAGNFQSVYCEFKNDNKPCPYCEMEELLMKKSNEMREELKNNMPEDLKQRLNSDDTKIKVAAKEEEKKYFSEPTDIYKIAKKHAPTLYYIIKLIDRNNVMNNGIQFWKVRDSYKKTGPYDKILSIIDEFGNITDPKNGRDLMVCSESTKTPTGRPYDTVSNILYKDQSKLFEDDKLIERILANSLSWKDIFKPTQVLRLTQYEYLKAALEGKAPYWDKNAKKWVNPLENKTTGTTGEPTKNQEAQLNQPPVIMNVDDTEDLPF